MPPRFKANLVEMIGASTPSIRNVALTLADTEYVVTLPTPCYRFEAQLRTAQNMLLRFAPGGQYLTIKANYSYDSGPINGENLTLYLSCTVAGQVAEIVYWE